MHWLTHFGSIDLPQYDVNFNAGPAPAALTVVQLVGGGTYDADGTTSSRQRYPLALRYGCTVVGPDAATARARVDELKALIGKRDRLWRTMIDDGETHWAWARLSDVDDTMRSRLPKWNIPCTLAFTVLGGWHGLGHQGPWMLDAGEYLDEGLSLDNDDLYDLTSSTETITIENGGNLAVRDAIVKVTAGDAPIMSVSVRSGLCDWTVTGQLGIGRTLVVDCAAKSVVKNGVNFYSGFSLGDDHMTPDWMVLEPGENLVEVERDGGGTGSTVEFVFADGWA